MLIAQPLNAQTSFTGTQLKTKFEAANLTLQADRTNVQEMKLQEIAGDLRPNPQFTLSQDGTQIAPHNGVWKPLSGTYVVPSLSYLHERDHKRELRLKSAQQGTQIATSQHSDLKRNLLLICGLFLCRRSRQKLCSR